MARSFLYFSCSRQFVVSPIPATELQKMDSFIKLESTPVVKIWGENTLPVYFSSRIQYLAQGI